MSVVTGILLLSLLVVPGLPLVLWWSRPVERELDWWEGIFFSAGTSLVVNGWIALVLSELGWFTGMRVATLAWLIGAAAWYLYRRRGWTWHPSWALPIPSNLIGIVALLTVGVIVYGQPAEWWFGGRDPGVYLNTAVALAKNGSLVIPEPTRSLISQEAAGQFTQFPGFYPKPDGTLLPQFFHVFPAMLAVVYDLAPGLTLWLSPVLGLTAILGIYTLLRRWGIQTALVGASLLTLNFAQIWYARGPYTEVLTQVFLFLSAGAWAVAARGHALAGFVSSVAVGIALLTRIDMVTVVPLMAIGVWWLGMAKRIPMSVTTAYTYGLMLTGVHAVVHATVFSNDYASDILALSFHWKLSVAQAVVITLGGMALVMPLVLTLWRRFGDGITAFVLRRRYWCANTVWFMLAGLLAYGYLIRPYVDGGVTERNLATYNKEAVVRLGWYLSPLGLVAGMLGFFFHLRRLDRFVGPFTVAAVFTCVFYLVNMRIYPDHFWAVRRFVPVVIPAFIVFATVLIGVVADRVSVRWSRPMVLLLTSLLLVIPIRTGWLFYGHREYAGSYQLLSEIAARVPTDAVILVNKQEVLVATPLRFMFDRLVAQTISKPKPTVLARQIRRWLDEGRQVFILAGDMQLGGFEPGLYYRYLGYVGGTVPRVRPRYDGFPNTIEQYAVWGHLYQAVRHDQPERTWDVGSAEDMNLGANGVYGREIGPNGTTFRWTSQRAELQLGAFDESTKYLLRLRLAGHRWTKGQPYRIYVNGQPVASLFSKPAFQSYQVALDSGLLRPGTNVLVLEAPTFVPAEKLKSSDTRELGMMLDQVQVEPITESGRLSASEMVGEGLYPPKHGAEGALSGQSHRPPFH